jgi:hypothetical protein
MRLYKEIVVISVDGLLPEIISKNTASFLWTEYLMDF